MTTRPASSLPIFGVVVSALTLLVVLVACTSKAPDVLTHGGTTPGLNPMSTAATPTARSVRTETPPANGTQTAAARDVDLVIGLLAKHVRQKGYDWVPEHNNLVDLPPVELRKRLGGIAGSPTIRAPEPLALAREAEQRVWHALGNLAAALPVALTRRAPDSVDYRSVGTPIRDQGGCGSCWAFASVAAMESQLRRADPNLPSDLDLSEQSLLSCAEGSCQGGWIAPALQFFVDRGAQSEACGPYEARDDESLCPPSCPRVETFHAASFGEAAPGRVVCSPRPDHRDDAWNEEVADALASRGPLVAMMSVPRELFYYGTGIYRFSGFFPDDPWAGCHVVTLVGYDRPERYWIIKNSWGTSWGEDGYARISWDDEYTHVGGVLFWLSVVGLTATPTLSPYPYPAPPTRTLQPAPTVEPPPSTVEPATAIPLRSSPTTTEVPTPTLSPYP